ncbi:hypothetical protein PM082_018198 [Marasmius tenuissimus]|nr:hypothetical protein PM082_018198 [Marasmius tenuissimus]
MVVSESYVPLHVAVRRLVGTGCLDTWIGESQSPISGSPLCPGRLVGMVRSACKPVVQDPSTPEVLMSRPLTYLGGWTLGPSPSSPSPSQYDTNLFAERGGREYKNFGLLAPSRVFFSS